MSAVYDLRSALDTLRNNPGELIETDRLVSPNLEIAGIYKKLSAGGSVMRPTKTGPALVFNNVDGFPGVRVAIGVMGNRKRVGLLMDTPPERLGFLYKEAADNMLSPVVVDNKEALCQEVVYRADEPGFDIRKIIPASKTTEIDAGGYITMGLCYAQDPETGEGNLAIHRMCLQSEDETTIGFGGYRHMNVFREKANRAGKPLPISINVGADPSIYISSCFQPPVTQLGCDELAVAGAIRKQPVELVKCLTIDCNAIANAEFVIEGELYPDTKATEDQHSGTGYSLPEFLGYMGGVRHQPVIKIKAVTCRKNPIWQMCVAPSEEHVNMEGIPLEAMILQATERAMPGKVLNVYGMPAGGGKLVAAIQFKKTDETDEGRQKQAGLVAFGVCPELKNVFVVDEDIDIFDTHEIMWAFTTRFKPEMDLSYITGVRCHRSDPTQKLYYDSSLRSVGIGTKAIYDCTVPFDAKEHFVRAKFMDVDISEFE